MHKMFNKMGTSHNNKYMVAIYKIKSILGKYFIVQFLAITILIIISVYSVFYSMSFVYKQSLIEKQIAVVQNDAALISAEFSNYVGLAEAQAQGVNDRLKSYSALNQIRIRLINSDYRVYLDTYSSDEGKTVLNSGVFDIFNGKKKSSSGYDKDTGIIEASVPVYNDDGELIAALIVTLNIEEVMDIAVNTDDKMDGIAIAVIILSMCMLFVVTLILERPVKKTYGIIHDVALGHTDERIPVEGYIELKNMAKDFNAILDKAGELDSSRAEFVSNVSHELKTPITSIKVLAESINSQDNVPVELYQEFMQDIVNEIDRESKIIEDLLSLVRLDKTTDALNLSSVNVNELLEMTLRRLKPLAEKKNIEILFETFRPVVAQIDEVKMTQVLSNLVENAIKYNNEDGWVHVSLNADHQYFYVRVEDSGIGIPEDSQNKIFERFYRVDKARSRQTGGTGLGLAIVKNIVLKHHGVIKVYSEEGQGTTFTIRIPLNYVEK